MKPAELFVWVFTSILFLIGALIVDVILTLKGKDRVTSKRNQIKK